MPTARSATTSASGSSSPSATRGACTSWSTRCSTSRASRRAACRRATCPTDLAALTADLASNFRSAMRARRASRWSVDCPPLRRARLRRSRDVGEDRPQPALQRLQVHLRGRDRRCACAARDGACGARRCATPARASRRTSCRACSSASTASRARAAARTRARGIGLALVQELVKLHGGDVQRREHARARAAPSRSPCRSGQRTSPASAIGAEQRRSPATALGRRRLRRGGAGLAARCAGHRCRRPRRRPRAAHRAGGRQRRHARVHRGGCSPALRGRGGRRRQAALAAARGRGRTGHRPT